MLATPREELVTRFRLQHALALGPRYNIAPGQPVAAVRESGERGRELVLLHWGLVPHWTKDPNSGNKMINARAETLAQKPSFRAAFVRRRCLLPADGFYEWKALNGRKQPYSIRSKDRRPFALAGLWEHWENQTTVIESCTIITTTANELLRPLHERMPVILAEEDYDRWLDCSNQDPQTLQHLLRPYDPNQLIAYPVSTRVNSPKNDDSECIAPIESE